METRMNILLVEIGALVIIQIVALIGILMAVKKSSARMTAIADDVHHRVVPLLDTTTAFVESTRPKLETIIGNLTETSERLKVQVEKIDSTVTDMVDRTRLQVVRADELVSRTMDRVEHTTEFVHHTVVSPVRQIAGLLQGLNTGFSVFFGKRAQGNGQGAQRDEMFI
jgi:methyl-accepting chemotaxis protein